ncbi:MAG: hypothetical protein AAGB12_03835 [Pseudomonadota bacterium]
MKKMKNVVLSMVIVMQAFMMPLYAQYNTWYGCVKPPIYLEDEPYIPFAPNVVILPHHIGIQINLLEDKAPIELTGGNFSYLLTIESHQEFSEVTDARLELILENDLIGDNHSEQETLDITTNNSDCEFYTDQVTNEPQTGPISRYVFENSYFSDNIKDGKAHVTLQIAENSTVKIVAANLYVSGALAYDWKASFGFSATPFVNQKDLSNADITKKLALLEYQLISRSALNNELPISGSINNEGDRATTFKYWSSLAHTNHEQSNLSLEVPLYDSKSIELDAGETFDFSEVWEIPYHMVGKTYSYRQYIHNVNSGEVKIFVSGLNINY